ncbi:MAG: 3-deoxy-8-phosphooctulonate synthase [Calditrichaeota bacterium]|nr:3-deoxy-8-phosphooctulonate synthase [Calditrichota bacterium]RQV98579.1 MAG: 3-deoxy-8-phosphooctulonate synthase [Calditrichota bacterium]
MKTNVTVGKNSLTIGKNQKLTIIAGPCVVENEKMIMETAAALSKIMAKQSFQYIFKASYRKANRTSVEGFTGLEFDTALKILEKVRNDLEIPVLTDVHNELEIPIVAQVVDVIQIPAFLSRQTDLLLRAGHSGKVVNIKKGQFMAPEDMAEAARKVSSTGNQKILLTERGTTFGYHNLVVDMRSLVIMEKIGYPVVYDATHSVQLPGGLGKASGGQPEFILPLLRAALATGTLSAVFMEVHPNPQKALSDASSQLSLDKFREVINHIEAIQSTVNKLKL